MTGFLRFIGVMNAAIWLGAIVFFTLAAGPALSSEEMRRLLGANNHPYFSEAIVQVILVRYYRLHLICAGIALAHLVAEWLYLRRPGRKFLLTLLACLLVLGWGGRYVVQPKLEKLHRVTYAAGQAPAARQSAARTFRGWRATSHVLNILIIGGLILYVWRVANPADSTRFVSSVKFRG